MILDGPINSCFRLSPYKEYCPAFTNKFVKEMHLAPLLRCAYFYRSNIIDFKSTQKALSTLAKKTEDAVATLVNFIAVTKHTVVNRFKELRTMIYNS